MKIQGIAVAVRIVLLSSFVLLVFAGCATPPTSAPRDVVFSDLPDYRNSRTNWTGGTSCMLYPCYGDEEHAGIRNLCCALKNTLQAHGYRVVEPDTYMSRAKRVSVDKIIEPVRYSPRSQLNNEGKTVWDLTAIVCVEDRKESPLKDSEPSKGRRYFQVWGRKVGSVPYVEVAEAFMCVDGFREALEPRSERPQAKLAEK